MRSGPSAPRRRAVEWRALSRTAARAGTRCSPARGPGPGLHWNEDVFDLPEGAEPLVDPGSARASRRSGPVGRARVGVQYHPDVDPVVLANWLRRVRPDQIPDEDPCARLRRVLPAQERASASLFDGFARSSPRPGRMTEHPTTTARPWTPSDRPGPDRPVPPLVRGRARRGARRAGGDARRHHRPASRYVLLRGSTSRGFTFFTNYGRPRAREIAADPRVALAFGWLPTAPLRPGDRGRGAPAGGGERRVLRHPPARQPHRRLGLAAVRGPRRPGRRSTRASRRPRRASPGSGVPRPPHWGGSSSARTRSSSGRAGRAACTTGCATGATAAAGCVERSGAVGRRGVLGGLRGRPGAARRPSASTARRTPPAAGGRGGSPGRRRSRAARGARRCRRVLDALGDRPQAEVVREVDGRAHDQRVVAGRRPSASRRTCRS